VLVEFALVMPILVMLLLGMVTTGLAYNRKLDLTHATREGARYGAAVSPFQQWTSGTWASNVRDLVIARASETLGTADVCVALVKSTSATSSQIYSDASHAATFFTTKSDGTACYADTYAQYSATDDGLRVQVSVARPAKIDLAVLPSINLTLRSTATAKSEQ
jgi:Flp pilus assembly protein TadG